MVTEPVLVRSGAIARNRWRSGIASTQTMSGRQPRNLRGRVDADRIAGMHVHARQGAQVAAEQHI
jgi:hypothetical protein